MNIKIMGEIGWDVDAFEIIEQIEAATEPISLLMLSGGGSAIHGFAIYDALRASEQKVTVKIFGFSASAASVIAMAADVVEMGDGALMMIHEASNGSWGTAEDHRESAEILDAWNSRLVQVYHNKTGIEKEALSEMVNKNEWINVDQAIELGFADKKLESFEVAASANLLLTRTKKESLQMSEPKTKAKEPKTEVEPTQAAEPVAKATEPVAKSEPKAEPKTEPQAAAEPVAKVEPKEEPKAEKGLGDFMAAFGDAEGAKMFLAKMSFSDAQAKHFEGVTAENASLKEQLETANAQLAAAQSDIGGDSIALTPVKTEAAAAAKTEKKSIVTIAGKK